MDYINTLFLIGAVLLCFSVLASSLSSRLGIPLLLIFLVIGMLAGVDGIGRIQFEDANSAFLIGSLALAIDEPLPSQPPNPDDPADLFNEGL